MTAHTWAVGAGGHIPHLAKVGDRGGQNISSTYYTHVTKSIFYTFTQSLCHCNKFQSRHNSHTGHCYVISFGAGKRLDVIITTMKYVQCFVSCPPGKQKVGVKIFFACSAREIVQLTFKTVAGVVCLQVKLCDPHLSALKVRFSRRGAIQIYVYLIPYVAPL